MQLGMNNTDTNNRSFNPYGFCVVNPTCALMNYDDFVCDRRYKPTHGATNVHMSKRGSVSSSAETTYVVPVSRNSGIGRSLINS